MNKIYINLGLPKTSTGNLQKNLYPKLKEFNYIGRFRGNRKRLTRDAPSTFHHVDKNIHRSINDYVENRHEIIKNIDDVNNLKINFKNYCEKSKRNILISDESWTCSYQKDSKTNKHIVVSHWEKIKRLNDIIKSTNLKSKYFIIVRNSKEAIPSFFATTNHRIVDIFGWKFKDINYFTKKVLEKDYRFEELNLLLDMYNINKIKNFFLKEFNDEIHTIDYDLINSDKKEFIKKLFLLLEIKIDYSFTEYLDIKTNVSEKDEQNQLIVYISHPNQVYEILLKIIETLKLKVFIKKIFIFFGFRGFKKKKYTIKTDQSLLNQAIELNENASHI